MFTASLCLRNRSFFCILLSQNTYRSNCPFLYSIFFGSYALCVRNVFFCVPFHLAAQWDGQFITGNESNDHDQSETSAFTSLILSSVLPFASSRWKWNSLPGTSMASGQFRAPSRPFWTALMRTLSAYKRRKSPGTGIIYRSIAWLFGVQFIGSLIDRLIGELFDWLIDWWVVRLIDWLLSCSIDWLIWLILSIKKSHGLQFAFAGRLSSSN